MEYVKGWGFNLSRGYQKALEHAARRGPTPDEIAREKLWAAEARLCRARRAAEAE